ncbi:PTS lactose/cellobiose transporter subunit IIA [Enterococcus faecalis]|uniref:PTS lactose/cellobiose transporter subunit IIA n=1 Tax=Enterococcus TaxID=1350 RepID=UPI000CF13FA0|nr:MULTISPECIES: PTS lactose/cellobiose transporter subunit IIA [Enterococcus]EME8106056.1 PTS lactose/cellobiose transporter subunit IIA [Enterococcus faecium]EHZ2966225.1 PTS lactose/cellobiose transporter subunit IIA [Enterococcus faecalis]EJJ1464766.1 PTS lactose/cellobiose transporter subunit IIA [Enterococcus faecalis]EME5462528.1 PTS lactose/cellobiose transporter subunit IIA [Enterococcus faecalis]MDT2524613.1 PTS lactose/cellobiose transporter subunit IIA [Enterococcus raffinosus]
MTTREEVSMIGFAIVAHAGDARSTLLEAMDCAKGGDSTQARTLVEEANESIVAAHKEQTKLLSEEAGGSDLEVSFIMIHAQDTLMTTMLFKDQAEYFINSYERITQLEEKLK